MIRKKLLHLFQIITSNINLNFNIVLFGSLLSTFVNVIITKLLTNKLSLNDYGIYTLIMSITSFPLVVLFAPLFASIFPFYNKYKHDEDQAQKFQDNIFEIFLFLNISLFLVIIIFWIFNFYFNFVSNDVFYSVFVAFFFTLGMSALTLLDNFSLAQAAYKEFSFFTVFNLVSKALLIYLLYNISIKAIVLVEIFSVFHFIYFIFEYFVLLKKNIIRKIKIKFNKLTSFKSEIKIEILNYSKNFFYWGFFAWTQNFFDKWILKFNTSKEDVAIFSVYYQYGFFPFTVLSSVIVQYLTPKYFSKNNLKGEMAVFLKNFIHINLIGVFVFLLVLPVTSFFIAGPILEILTNSNYLIYINQFPLMVISGCFFCMAQILNLTVMKEELISQARLPKIVLPILSVILYWILIPLFQIKGLFISLVVVNFLYFISMLIINIRIKNKLNLKLN